MGRAGRRPRPRPGLRLGAAHLRMGGEEECTGTADTNPGCNYLVRGYSPSMHYFCRGDMPHFSPPLPFQRGRAECRRVLARDLGGPDRGPRACRAAAVPRPPQPARRQPRPARAARQRVPGCGGPPTPTAGAPSTSAGQSGAPARAGQRWSLTRADGVPSTSAGQTPLQTGASQAQPARPQCGGA